jgi:uncharacterized membrane protein YqjE
MTDGVEEERPGIQDIPRLVKTLIERTIDLGSARIQLAQLEIKEEIQERVRRGLIALIFVGFLLVGFALLNVGLVSWLGESLGITGAAFLLSGIYFLIGIGVFLWFRSTGGLNPPEKAGDDDDDDD